MIQGYPSDLTDEQWALLEPLFAYDPHKRGRKFWQNHRDCVDAVFYVVKTGCQWRQLPLDFPPWKTVHSRFSKWKRNGMWTKILEILTKKVREQEGKKEPSYGILDSQSVKSSRPGLDRGYDGNKKVKGRKRHIMVDTLGLLLSVYVHSANIHDTKAAEMLMKKGLESYPSLQAFSGDEGYRKTAEEAASTLGKEMHISRRIKDEFAVLPKRWVVERSFAWLNGYRRLSKDYEDSTSSSETMVQIAFIKILLNKLKY